ncbi:hypothetical protein ATANTOWER_032441, partial [Ataeniobius toweri]|nr:hypothetical protein [Ataeniobius toweri]
PGTRIASLCSDSSASSMTHQPQLICIGDLRSLKHYVIVAKNDKVTIPLDDGLTCAVDKLFKLYWVCNLTYPPQLRPVFTFFEYIYDLPFSTQRKAKVLELIAQGGGKRKLRRIFPPDCPIGAGLGATAQSGTYGSLTYGCIIAGSNRRSAPIAGSRVIADRGRLEAAGRPPSCPSSATRLSS